jgi:YD repeat-containing protein
MTYNYSSTQNSGRITSSVDGVTGENTTYTYDALNRLTGASNSQWSETYAYDGFGNLTSKVGTGARLTQRRR